MVVNTNIDKYKTRSISSLTDPEKLQEVLSEKYPYSLHLYKADLDFSRKHNLNVSRIIRLKFHEWLQEKFGME